MGPLLHWGTATRLAAALVVGSLVAAGLHASWLLLSPDAVLHGAVWQLVSYCFIETGTMHVLFGAVILISIGGMLETWWGRKKMLRFVVGVPVVSGVLTTVLALVIPSLRTTYFAGGAAMVSATWCAYGWSLGQLPTNFWGITVTGNQLAAIGIGFVVMQGAFGSVAHAVPEALAIALAYGYVRRFRP